MRLFMSFTYITLCKYLHGRCRNTTVFGYQLLPRGYRRVFYRVCELHPFFKIWKILNCKSISDPKGFQLRNRDCSKDCFLTKHVVPPTIQTCSEYLWLYCLCWYYSLNLVVQFYQLSHVRTKLKCHSLPPRSFQLGFPTSFFPNSNPFLSPRL